MDSAGGWSLGGCSCLVRHATSWLLSSPTLRDDVEWFLNLFYHLSLGENWTFRKAYALAIVFVLIEYLFNVLGNRRASEALTVVQLMVLVSVIDFMVLFVMNSLVLHNPVYPLRDGASIVLLLVALVVSTQGKV